MATGIGNGFRDWLLGIIGALAIAGIGGMLKLYSDIQVHFNKPMHEGTDKKFDKLDIQLHDLNADLRSELRGLDDGLRRTVDYDYMMIQILAEKTHTQLPTRPSR